MAASMFPLVAVRATMLACVAPQSHSGVRTARTPTNRWSVHLDTVAACSHLLIRKAHVSQSLQLHPVPLLGRLGVRCSASARYAAELPSKRPAAQTAQATKPAETAQATEAAEAAEAALLQLLLHLNHLLHGRGVGELPKKCWI